MRGITWVETSARPYQAQDVHHLVLAKLGSAEQREPAGQAHLEAVRRGGGGWGSEGGAGEGGGGGDGGGVGEGGVDGEGGSGSGGVNPRGEVGEQPWESVEHLEDDDQVPRLHAHDAATVHMHPRQRPLVALHATQAAVQLRRVRQALAPHAGANHRHI